MGHRRLETKSVRGAATDDVCLFACIFFSVKFFFDMFGAGILVSR